MLVTPMNCALNGREKVFRYLSMLRLTKRLFISPHDNSIFVEIPLQTSFTLLNNFVSKFQRLGGLILLK